VPREKNEQQLPKEIKRLPSLWLVDISIE